MSGKNKNTYLIYRGDLRAITSLKSALIFTTVHTEGHETGVYHVDLETNQPTKAHMPGGVALVRDDKSLMVAGVDGHIWRGLLSKKSLEAVGEVFEPAPTALALLSGKKLAVGHGANISVVSREDASVAQVITLPERVTTLAADKSGEWLVAGTDRGMVFVFTCEDRKDWVESASAKLHEGEVTSLLFENEELRVLSTGSDLKLLVTHVRGALDPEDRGGSGMHEKAVTAMIHGIEDRFYSTGMDSCVKAWPSGRTNRRPTTQRDGVVRTVGMALVEYNERPHLALAGVDGAIRLFEFEDEGKVGECVLTLRDAHAWADNEFRAKEPKRREAALRKLASFNDTRSLDQIAQQAGNESDHKLKVLATELFGESGNPRAIKKLEVLLRDSSEDVRVAALEGLRTLEGRKSLRPLELALAVHKKDVGTLAIKALGELAREDDKALDLITQALDMEPAAVSFAALESLEKHYGIKTPDAHLIALRSNRADIRKAAMIRCFQLGLLGDMRVEAALRRMCEDRDANLRLNAYLITLLRRPTLASALRGRDEVIHRQLFDIENYGKSYEKGKEPELPTVKEVPVSKLVEDDWSPLLEAMASRQLDICMRGAQGLALLQDTRAFGTLLQLSRENDASARVQACKSLEALGDPRSLKRLRMMLRDGAPAVRDAAFSALYKLEEDEPLEAARAGLTAEHEDVRKRGLQVLVEILKSKKSADKEVATELLRRTLNDNFQPVRSEAFKACLSIKIGGGTEAALRFGNQSIYSDVRLDVLVEVMAQYEDDWAWTMLLEFFEDPESELRSDAFEYALKKAKKDRREQSLSSALSSRYEDIRLLAVEHLTTRKLDDFEDLLVIALDDDAQKVRARTVDALVRADAHTLLVKAMKSKHADIRVRAASAVAGMGDGDALPVLVALATASEPDKDNNAGEHRDWLSHVCLALEGIAELGDSSVRESIRPLIESKHANIRKAAVRALVWTSRRESLDTLREVVRHADDAVKKEAALGLAYHGDSLAAGLVFGGSASSDEKLLAALGVIEDAEDQFLSFLDVDNTSLKRRAFLLLLLLEFAEDDGVPDKCLAALSSKHSDIRLLAAMGIEVFPDRDGFKKYIHDTFNTLLAQGKDPFTVEAATVNRLAHALAFGSVQVKIRAARLLETLDASSDEEFKRRWDIYERRYGTELDALVSRSGGEQAVSAGETEGRFKRAWRLLKNTVARAKGQSEEKAEFDEALAQLVFGAYVGLSRDPSRDTVRLGALRRMTAMAKRDENFVVEVERVMLLALGDNHAEVRKLAFDNLLDLGLSAELLSNEALSTGHADMGSRGLELLASRGEGDSGDQLLREVLLTKTDGLEREAAKLLADRTSWAKVWRIGLGALSQDFRRDSLNNLVRGWETEEGAKDAVIQAMTSRFEDVRFSAAEELSRKSPDGEAKQTALGVLLEMIERKDYNEQNRGISGLQRLGDSAAAPKMLDRIDNDEEGSANVDILMKAAASFRDRNVFDRLLDYIDRDVNRWGAFQAALTITGYDQYIEDPEDENEDRSWLEKQQPHHDDLLAKLLDISYRLADGRMLQMLVPRARWALTNAADPYLAPLATFSKENIQHAAIEAIGWRLRKRDGSPDVLLRLLRDGSPTAQFIAAEALALAGRKDGISVLMTAVNFMEDYEQRRRAIFALGQLGDPQALDLLLEIVQDDESYLRPAAAEAIGHMAKSDRADDVFKLLVGLNQDNYDLAKSALTGLRYFNTREAWRVIRKRAREGSWWLRQHAAEMLGYNDDQANIELLSRIITSGEEDDSDVVDTAATSLRRIFGPDSLEADYVLVQSEFTWLEAQEGMIKRLREKGDAARLLEVLPRISEEAEDEFLAPLVTALLSREPLPVDDVAGLLGSDEVRTATVAAQIVGRAGKSAARHGDTLVAATEKAHGQWLEARKLVLSNQRHGQAMLDGTTERYKLLVWACGRLEVGFDAIASAAQVPQAPRATEIQHAALIALSSEWVGQRGIKVLEAFIHGNDANLRQLAATSLRQIDPERAREILSDTLEDASTFNRLFVRGEEAAQEVLRKGAGSIHLQGVVLGHMAENQDVDGFAATLKDDSLSDEIRLGAIEGLAEIATEAVDALLIAVGTNEEEDEELRKSAWRALRRARRARARRQESSNEVSA